MSPYDRWKTDDPGFYEADPPCGACGKLSCDECFADLQQRGLVAHCHGCDKLRLTVELVTYADGDSVGCGKGPAKLCIQCRHCDGCKTPLVTFDDFCAGKCSRCRSPLADQLLASLPVPVAGWIPPLVRPSVGEVMAGRTA